jgi:hypothetical protein
MTVGPGPMHACTGVFDWPASSLRLAQLMQKGHLSQARWKRPNQHLLPSQAGYGYQDHILIFLSYLLLIHLINESILSLCWLCF